MSTAIRPRSGRPPWWAQPLTALGLAGIALAGVLAGPPETGAAPAGEARVHVTIVSEVRRVAPGATFWVGVRQRIAPGWHTYWTNPGDSGEPLTIEWQLPPELQAGPIAWPAPHRIPVGPAMSFGYTNEVVLPVPMTAGPGLAPGSSVTLRGQASWLVCEKICIPESAPISLALPVGPATPDPAGAATLARARQMVPGPSPWPVSFQATRGTITLAVAAPGLARERLDDVWFYPARWGAIEHAAPQQVDVSPAGMTIRAARGALAEAVEEPIDGVLVITERLERGTVTQAFLVRATPGAAGSPLGPGLPRALVLAFLGGLALNAMPCVLPVLSVKTLALVRHATAARAAMAQHGLAYTLGVLVSFAALAGLLLALRAAGEQIGWGFQLQSPGFVTLLAYLLFTMGLVLSGMLPVSNRLGGIGHGLAARNGYTGSFFTGALASIAATPCTAPFMGTAVGYAVTQPWGAALLVFLTLGLGLALPFLLLSLAPGWRRYLPRPGPWMGRLQQLLAFPLYASAAWLIWVLSQQVGPPAVGAALTGLLLLAFAAWLRGAASGARPGWRRAATLGAFAAAGLALATVGLAGSPARSAGSGRAAADPTWEPFSPERLAELRAAGTPVFVNLTAAWCITCLVNDRVALGSPAVARAFADKGVARLRGDWTRRDPEITELLAQYGRNGVPLYLLYPQQGGDAVVLPQILSEETVIEAVGKI